MKILLLTYRGNPFCGGQGVYVSHLAREITRLGHEVHCIHGPPYAPEDSGAVWHRVPGLHLFPARAAASTAPHPLAAFTPLGLLERGAALSGQFPEMAAFSWRAFAKLRALSHHHRFDVVHDNQSLGWGLLAVRALGLPILSTVHHPLTIDRARGFDPPASFRRRFGKVRFYPTVMQGFVARRMTRIVTVSHASARAIAADFRVAPERIRVIYNGLDTVQFRPLPEVASIPGRVVFVGNLEDANKGGVYLLRAIARLKSPAHLVIATGGLSRPDWLQAQIDGLGLRGRITVRYRLPAPELVRLYASAEVAVSPSLFEGFGFPAAEAMACEVPLVAARGGALPEVVGDAGVLVPPADSEALAQAIAALLADPQRRQRLGRAARQRVLALFRWEEAARQLLTVYRETIDAHH